MNYTALLISVLALSFTVISFWWMNWRKGNLNVGVPRAYAARGSRQDALVVELPFVFFNDGPTPIIVQNLRLVLADEQPAPNALTFMATVEKLGTDEGRAFATQFPVRGREALRLVCEFQRRPGNLAFERGIYNFELQAILNNFNTWETLCSFPINVTSQDVKTINQQFIVHDNWQNSIS